MGVIEDLMDDLTPPERLEYTWRAFNLVPHIDSPRILDVGCGSGQPTIELARLSEGSVVGVDLDARALKRLREHAWKAGVSSSVETINRSFMELDLPESSFDLVWAEASLHNVGVEKGIREISRFLKPGGYMVVHESVLTSREYPEELAEVYDGHFRNMETTEGFLEMFSNCGFEEIDHFSLPEDAWEGMYFEPLFERIDRLRTRYSADPDALSKLDRQERDNSLMREHIDSWGSAFFVMRKR